jgi:hypothetical protein
VAAAVALTSAAQAVERGDRPYRRVRTAAEGSPGRHLGHSAVRWLSTALVGGSLIVIAMGSAKLGNYAELDKWGESYYGTGVRGPLIDRLWRPLDVTGSTMVAIGVLAGVCGLIVMGLVRGRPVPRWARVVAVVDVYLTWRPDIPPRPYPVHGAVPGPVVADVPAAQRPRHHLPNRGRGRAPRQRHDYAQRRLLGRLVPVHDSVGRCAPPLGAGRHSGCPVGAFSPFTALLLYYYVSHARAVQNRVTNASSSKASGAMSPPSSNGRSEQGCQTRA